MVLSREGHIGLPRLLFGEKEGLDEVLALDLF